MKTETGIGVVLSCSHPAVNADIFGGEDHGHSYLVIVWFDNDCGRDARVLRVAVDTIARTIDHKLLPEELSTGEALSRYFMTIANVVEVEVRRDLERLYARTLL